MIYNLISTNIKMMRKSICVRKIICFTDLHRPLSKNHPLITMTPHQNAQLTLWANILIERNDLLNFFKIMKYTVPETLVFQQTLELHHPSIAFEMALDAVDAFRIERTPSPPRDTSSTKPPTSFWTRLWTR
jgi:hypothetical protein